MAVTPNTSAKIGNWLVSIREIRRSFEPWTRRGEHFRSPPKCLTFVLQLR
jgi:hypothetical protein